MKKILKTSLFIIGFSLLLLILSNSNVQAADKTITTVQELQKAIGAEEYSIIEGTTLKITNNFETNITDSLYISIPEVTIDFNGKEIKMLFIGNTDMNIQTGKVILKDTTGEKGGIIIESEDVTKYRAGIYLTEETVLEMEGIRSDVELIRSEGATILANNSELGKDIFLYGGSGDFTDCLFEEALINVDGFYFETDMDMNKRCKFCFDGCTINGFLFCANTNYKTDVIITGRDQYYGDE